MLNSPSSMGEVKREIITAEEARQRLCRVVARAGGVSAFAARWSISAGYVSMATRGKAKIGPDLQARIGVSAANLFFVTQAEDKL